MSAKKTAKTSSKNQKPIKIGSRLRCTDDGVEGRIVWANATSVQIKWDDGEQVTWKRDALADKPIVILDEASGGEPAPQPEATPEPVPTTESAVPQPTVDQSVPPEPINSSEMSLADQPEVTTATGPAPADQPVAESATVEQSPAEQPGADAGIAEAQTSAPAKPKRQRRAKQTEGTPQEKKLSAIDAAAKVLAETGQAMNCVELIEAMAQKGYWSSPAGKTPAATLYSAILRELQTKGDQARFVKADRGQFAIRPTT